jgi:hypothetical protein
VPGQLIPYRLLHLRLVVKTALPSKGGASVASLGTITLVATGLALLVASGWAIAEGHAKGTFLAVTVVGVCILAFTKRGAFIGLILLATMNGLPFIDTSSTIFAKYTVQDAAVCALLVIIVLWLFIDNGTHHPSRISQTISRAAFLLLLWWLLTLARTVIGQGVPLQHAASFGREFLYFALLLMLLPRARLTRRDIHTLLVILAVGVCVFAVGQIMIATGVGQSGSLIHFERTLHESGLTRVYAQMTDMVDAGLAVSVAAILLARGRAIRLIASPIALLLMISVAVQLTRARWVGLAVSFLIVSFWFLTYSQARASTLLRKRLILAASVIAITGAAVVVAVPGILPGATLTHRLLSIVTNIQGNSGTVAVRETASKTLTGYLGGQWPFGLGFIPPSFHYFTGMPEGSIRDTDLGALNAIVTMGIVGAVLIYTPVLLTLVHCLRRASAQQTPYDWLRYGGAIWFATALISSVTLVTLFSASGLALTAVFLTMLMHPSVSGALAPSTNVSTRAAPTTRAQPKHAFGPTVTSRVARDSGHA